jgi:outer membrane protein
MMDTNPEYRAHYLEYQAKKQSIVQARARFLPRLSVSASKSRTYLRQGSEAADGIEPQTGSATMTFSEIEQSAMFDTDIGAPVVQVSTNDYYNSNSASLDFYQPIYDKQNGSRLRVARSEVIEAEYFLEQIHEDLILRLSEKFFDLISQRSSTEIIKEELDVVKSQLEITTRRHAERLGNLTDVYETKSRYLKLKADFFESQANHRIGLLDINELASSTSLATVDFHVSLNTRRVIPKWVAEHSVEDLVSVGINRDYQIKLAEQKVETAKYMYKSAAAKYHPTLGLSAQRVFDKRAESAFLSNRELHSDQLMLQLKVPLFAGFESVSKRRESHLTLQSSIKSLEAKRIAQATKIRKSYYLLEVNLQRLALLADANQEINRAVILRRKGYEQGISSNLSYLETLAASYSSKKRLEIAKVEAAQNWVQVLAAFQNLDFQEVQKINKLFFYQ